VCYATGIGVKVDQVEALKWYIRAGDLGSSRAQYEVGRAYQGGLGVKVDYDMALKWFMRAAEQDEPLSLGVIGTLHPNTTSFSSCSSLRL